MEISEAEAHRRIRRHESCYVVSHPPDAVGKAIGVPGRGCMTLLPNGTAWTMWLVDGAA